MLLGSTKLLTTFCYDIATPITRVKTEFIDANFFVSAVITERGLTNSESLFCVYISANDFSQIFLLHVNTANKLY